MDERETRRTSEREHEDQITKLRSTLDTEGKEKAQVIASNAEITKRVSSLEAELTQQRELHTQAAEAATKAAADSTQRNAQLEKALAEEQKQRHDIEAERSSLQAQNDDAKVCRVHTTPRAFCAER